MEQLGTILHTRKKATTDANSERADMMNQLLAFMGEDKWSTDEKNLAIMDMTAAREEYTKRQHRRFKYWLGRTRRLAPGAIFGLIKRAREGKNPPALFNWLLKNELSTSAVDNRPRQGV
jgi:hypothetical protein